MRFNFLFNGHMPGYMDLDKKLPDVVKAYPEAKSIKKAQYIDVERILGKDIIKNLNVVKFFGKEINSEVQIDLYASGLFCYSFFSVSFDIDEIDLSVSSNEMRSLIMGMEFSYKNEIISLHIMLLRCLLPYYNMEQLQSIEQEIDGSDVSKLTDNINRFIEGAAIRPYSILGPHQGLNFGPNPAFIIESYDGSFQIDSDEWSDIGASSTLYSHNRFGSFICTGRENFEDFFKHHFLRAMKISLRDCVLWISDMWLESCNAESRKIRENIVSDNMNSYYWKELKKEIEIIDLNFLEFHSHAVQILHYENDNRLYFSDKYNQEYLDILKRKTDLAFSKIREVQYAIRNISTPSHTHDEQILQEETEKVNDRILMFTFVAMAVSAVGLMQSSELDFSVKILSGAGIFFLPVIYYMARSIQKKLLFKRNERLEIDKRMDNLVKSIDSARSQMEEVSNEPDLPDDFRNEGRKFFEMFVSTQQEKLKRFKKKHNLK